MEGTMVEQVALVKSALYSVCSQNNEGQRPIDTGNFPVSSEERQGPLGYYKVNPKLTHAHKVLSFSFG